MKPNPLFSRFELIADTQGNIQLLRKLVVHLAVSGRLLDTLGNAPSTPEILSNIASKTQALIKSGKAKKHRVLPPIDETELPAGCHGSSRFERLENVATLERGLTAIQRAKPGEYPLVTTGERKSSCDHYDFDGRAAVIPMVSSTGHGSATLKRLHYQEGKFAVGNILCAVFPISDELISARFIFEYLTAFKEELLVSKMIGTANVSLTLSKIGEVPIPIVPPVVQRRVDELMALCDDLEVARAEQESRRDRLTAASHHRLNEDLDTNSLRGVAQFFIGQLQRLTARPDQLKQLRQTILNLAVRGHLTHICAESAIKSSSCEATLKGLDISLPAHWSIEPLAKVAAAIVDCPHSTPKWTTEGKICVRTNQFRAGQLDLSAVRFVSESTYLERIQRLEPAEDDILYSREGGILGVACRVPPNTPLCLGQRMMLIRPGAKLDAAFLEMVLNSPLIAQIALDKTTGGAAPRINVATVKAYPIPLPPLTEQRRIVAKVDELMTLCDNLEMQLTTAQIEKSRLLKSVLHLALHGETARSSEDWEEKLSAVLGEEIQLRAGQ